MHWHERYTANLYCLFLNEELQPFRSERLQKGTINRVKIYAREVVRRSLVVGASAIVLIKNIPSGRLTATTEEAKSFSELKVACSIMDIPILDVVLVGPNGVRSVEMV